MMVTFSFKTITISQVIPFECWVIMLLDFYQAQTQALTYWFHFNFWNQVVTVEFLSMNKQTLVLSKIYKTPIFLCVCVHLLVCICTTYVQVNKESRRRLWISLGYCYRWLWSTMWMLRTESNFSVRAPNQQTMSLAPCICYF